MTISDVVRQFEKGNPKLVDLVRRERPYRIPRGYMPWNTMSALLAASIISWKNWQQLRDKAAMLNVARLSLWFVQDAPIYCLSKDLLRAFEETDVLNSPELLADLHPPLPTALLLFPQNAVQTPDGTPLDFCVIHLSDKAHPERSQGKAFGIEVPYLPHEYERNLHWSGVDQEEVCWFAGAGLELDGSVVTTNEQAGSEVVNDAEHQFLNRMRSLVLQCLLTITYRPDLLEDAAIPQQGFGKPRQGKGTGKQVEVRSPRWLGKDYKRPAQAPGPAAGTHASPREHWRRGHWRRVVEGPRELGQRRWVWIEPTFIKGG